MLEIERKFLVKSDAFKQASISKEYILQGFLNTHPERTVRVRVAGDFGYLTIKGKSNESGTTRFEWEREIAVADAMGLLKICEEGVIEKTRFLVVFGGHNFEIDQFHGANEGLVIAEIELEREDETFERPDWLGYEVTGDVKYYNSHLSTKPYNKW